MYKTVWCTCKVVVLPSKAMFTRYRIAFCGATKSYISSVVWTTTRYANLHFRDRSSAASLRHKNRTATIVLVCEQKPYPVWFRGGAKAIRHRVIMPKRRRRIVSPQFSRSLHTLLSWSLEQAMGPVTVSTISVSRDSMRWFMGGTWPYNTSGSNIVMWVIIL